MSATLPNALRSTAALRDVLPSRGPVLIVPHDYPDPDALASAAGLHLLLERAYHLHSRIVFTGAVDRAENKVLLRHYRYRWHFSDELRPLARRRPAIFVDTWPGAGNVTMPPSVRPVGAIDHHPPPARTPPDGWYVDVQPAAGATATLVFGYLREAGVEIPAWLASAMAYAIETETMAFTRPATDADREAYGALIARANLRMIGEIRNAPLPRDHFAQLQAAIANARIYGNLAWTHLEDAEPPEMVAEVADLLLRIERVTASFCTGARADQLLVSLRGERRDARCGRIVQEAVRPDGRGGGHDRMAAGVVPLAGLSPKERAERLRRLQTALLRRMVSRARWGETDAETLGRALTGAVPTP